MFRLNRFALAATLSMAAVPMAASAFPDCPADSGIDGYTCEEQTGEGKNGGFFRVTFPSNWDGDLVIINHGFDLNDKHIRPHEVCGNNAAQVCDQDADCVSTANDQFCNNISYQGLDEVLLPMGKAVAAGTYRDSGWAPFSSSKDMKDIIKYVDKYSGRGDDLKRVIITGFSGGGAVTADAIFKLSKKQIHGAVPLCGAVAGGLPTWDVAMDIRMIYDYLCDAVPGGSFNSAADLGEQNGFDSGADSIQVYLKVNTCLGNVTPSGNPVEAAAQAARLADFLALSSFDGDPGVELTTAMGFATLGLGDFVRDAKRLKGKSIGLNDTLDYTAQGVGGPLAAAFNAGVDRLTKGKGRSKLRKAFWTDFTKGKGKNVAFPILSMAGSADWLVIPEFQDVFTTALDDGAKPYTQTWISTYGHCVFSEEEITAVFSEYFTWLGPDGGPNGPHPTPEDIEAACLALPTGIDGDTCNFDSGFVPNKLFDRIPARSDWPLAATH